MLPALKRLRVIPVGWNKEQRGSIYFLRSVSCPALEEFVIIQKVGNPTTLEYIDPFAAGKFELEGFFEFDLLPFLRRSNFGLKRLVVDCDMIWLSRVSS